MNCTLLLRKELKLLLNKKIIFVISIIFIGLFYSCGSKKDDAKQELLKKYNDQDFVLAQAKKVLGENVKFAYKGKFDQDSTLEIAAGTETSSPKEWGIRFYLLKLDGTTLKKVYESDLVNGSFKDCLVKKIKFPDFNHELIYYNSQDYFLGSGGGEVYSYLVNLDQNKIYYAHLVAEQRKPVSLYLSSNIEFPDLKNFFLSNFKRDYPTVNLVNKDIVLQD